MLRLEDREWRSFAISEIASISPGRRLTKADMLPGNMPFIGASDSCNGITEYTSNRNESEDCNVLGVNYNGSVVESFYHPYRALFSDDVKRLHLLGCKGNQYIYLFLKTLILKQKSKYQYAYKFNESRLKRQKILIPVTSSGEPDYEFMEAYGRQLLARKIAEYEDCARGVLSGIECAHVPPLSKKDWRNFKISGEGGIFINHHGKRLVKEKREKGLMPFLTAGENNNGVAAFVSNADLSIHEDVITVDMFGNSFFHGYRCAGDDNIYFFKNPSIGKYVMLFVSCVINKNKSKFSYGKQFRQGHADALLALLPSTPSGEPDYDYMEQYAKNIHHKKITEYLDYLGAAKKDLTG